MTILQNFRGNSCVSSRAGSSIPPIFSICLGRIRIRRRICRRRIRSRCSCIGVVGVGRLGLHWGSRLAPA